MKLHYADQGAPDEDDHALQAAVRQGHVPETCLMGGTVLRFKIEAGHDPCGDCSMDRERCKGRPRLPHLLQNPPIPHGDPKVNDTPGERRERLMLNAERLRRFLSPSSS